MLQVAAVSSVHYLTGNLQLGQAQTMYMTIGFCSLRLI